MFTNVWHFDYHLQGFVTHILRMRSGKADTHSRNSLSNSAKQHRESNHFILSLKTIGINVLTQQSYFFITFIGQITHLIQDTLYITATLPATSIRHNTIVTKIIAAPHNADKARNMVSADT